MAIFPWRLLYVLELTGSGTHLHANAVKVSDCYKRFSCTDDCFTKEAMKELKLSHLDEGMDL